jgi:phosphatidylserine decarboxylase
MSKAGLTTPGLALRRRADGTAITETVLGDRLLRLAYSRPVHPLLAMIAFRTGWLTRLLGWYADRPLSRGRIPRVIDQLAIDTTEFAEPPESFASFNDFFIRRLKPDARPFAADPQIICSPADCRLLAFAAVNETTNFPVKGLAFNVSGLLGIDPEAELAQEFAGATVVVCRLSPADYHRYHFPAAGRVIDEWRVGRKYDSVHPVALASGLPVFSHNIRHVWQLDLEPSGPAAFVEVGAFGVGRIVQTHQGRSFHKMDEKGYFAFGGSTIVLLFRAGTVKLDEDLLRNTRENSETLVRAGETIARTL